MVRSGQDRWNLLDSQIRALVQASGRDFWKGVEERSSATCGEVWS
jgi:hypothetical protein